MGKLTYKFFFLFALLFSNSAHSVMVENCDAFQVSDNLALRDVETGLVWLDFGVNNGESINSVVGKLDSLYAGWRLPKESEVIDFWLKLAASDLTDIFDYWGANKTPADNLPYLAWGYFIDDDGYLGAAYIKEILEVPRSLSTSRSIEDRTIVAGIEKKIIDVKYDGSDYYLFELAGAAEISTLLVKKHEVSEPRVFNLTLICLFSLLVHLARKKFSFWEFNKIS